MLPWLLERAIADDDFNTVMLIIKLICKNETQTEAKIVIFISNFKFFHFTYKDKTVSSGRMHLHLLLSLNYQSIHVTQFMNISGSC